jgi:hypothetical protein
MVCVPVLLPVWHFLKIDVEAARNALKSKGGQLKEPGKPCVRIFW